MLAQTERSFHPLLLLFTFFGLLAGCADEKSQLLDPAQLQLPSFNLEPLTISGSLLDSDGNSLCEPGGRFPEGSIFRIFVIDPNMGPGGGTVLNVPFECGAGDYLAEVPPGTYYLRVSLPEDPDNVGGLPWRYLEPTPVTVEDGNVVRDIRIFDGVPMGGSATLDGLPVEGLQLDLLFSPLSRYFSGSGMSRSDGTWEDRIPGRTLMVQAGVEHQVWGTSCFSLGTRLVGGVPEEPFSFPTEVSALDCELETSPAVDLTHDATRLVVTPMPGDVGGMSATGLTRSELDDEWGFGWGVQFPVAEGVGPQHGPYNRSQLYKGGLMVGIGPDGILTGVDVGGHLECGAACRDLGLDGSVKTHGSEVVWSYTDGVSPEGVGLAVEQRSFDGEEGSDYVLFQFGFTNTGSSTLTFYPGFFGDWDVDGQDGTPGYHTNDIGFTELDGRLMYVTNEGDTGPTGTNIGTAWFGDNLTFGNHFRSGGEGGLDLGGQFEALNGTNQNESVGPADVYYIHGSGPVTLLPGQSADRWMAVVAGDNKEQLLASTAAAEADVAERSRKASTLEITIVDLGFLDTGNSSRGWSVNDSGQAVGYSRTTPDNSALHAFVWTEEDGMVDLGTYPGHAIGSANDINNKGEIAGFGRVEAGAPRQPWFRDQEGEMTLLEMPPGWSWSYPWGISHKGEVVGWGRSDTYRAFLWTKKDGMMDLGTLPEHSDHDGAVAWDINDHGAIVGSSFVQGSSTADRAFIWTKKAGMVSLGTLGGGPTDAHAINNRGEIVGLGWPDTYHAFLWTEEDGMMDLGFLPGHNSALARDINDKGDIVGRSLIHEDYASNRAFLWTWEHGMVNLGTLDGGDYSEAHGINKQGLVVGQSRGADGLMHAVMWVVEEVKK